MTLYQSTEADFGVYIDIAMLLLISEGAGRLHYIESSSNTGRELVCTLIKTNELLIESSSTTHLPSSNLKRRSRMRRLRFSDETSALGDSNLALRSTVASFLAKKSSYRNLDLRTGRHPNFRGALVSIYVCIQLRTGSRFDSSLTFKNS